MAEAELKATVNFIYKVKTHPTMAGATEGEMKVTWADPDRLLRDFPEVIKTALQKVLETEKATQ